MAAKIENQVQKLALRQVRGCLQTSARSSSVKFFQTYSRDRCFKLNDLLDSEGEIKNGHVILGFTKDGCHLISYSLVIDTRLELPEPLYSYMLHWWRFRYNKPLIKVHSVALFSNHDINDTLHLIISQSLDEKQVIVWGRSSPCSEEQSCRCYVTICATAPSKPCVDCQQTQEEKCIEHSFAVHFTYNTLPPYPVFLPSVSLQIPGVVLFNCGDSLVAMKCTPCSQSSQLEDALQNFTPNKSTHNGNNLNCKHSKHVWQEVVNIGNNDIKDEEQNTHSDTVLFDCEKFNEQNNGKIVKNNDINESKACSNASPSTGSPSALRPHDLLVSSMDSTISIALSQSKDNASYNSCKDINYNNDNTQTKYSFRLYHHANATAVFDECDIVNREIPVNVMSSGHQLSMASCNTLNGMAKPSVLVCQAFLDMEECINVLIQSHRDLCDRYKSLRDYDCQLLTVCQGGDVVVMLKVLIYAKRTRSCLSEGLQVSPSPELYQTGFIFSWNIWNGQYQTLHFMDVKDHPLGKGFSKSDSSMETSRNLRRQMAIPVGFSSQVRVFSNHTVFSEKSLKYLLHPFLPIMLVL